MSLLLFLNELSEVPLAPDVREARARMNRFIGTLKRVQYTLNGVAPILRLQRKLADMDLSAQYPIARWLNDVEVEREHRQWLGLLATRAPLFPSRGESPKAVDPEDRVDCFLAKQEALAIGAAHLTDGLPISFLSAPAWNTPWLAVTIHALDALANVVVTEENMRHASASEHIDVHADWLRVKTRTSVRDGRDLWDKRNALFPALEMCNEVRGHLAGFRGGDPALPQILKRLTEMQRFFVDWPGSSIRPSSLPSKCTPESASTLAKFEQEHTFTRPNGARLVFSWHVRFTPGAGRIFFDGDPLTRKGMIGCIARDGLPTVNDST